MYVHTHVYIYTYIYIHIYIYIYIYIDIVGPSATADVPKPEYVMLPEYVRLLCNLAPPQHHVGQTDGRADSQTEYNIIHNIKFCFPLIYIYVYIYNIISICIYLYISRNIGGQSIRTPTGAASGDRGGSFLILAAFLWGKRRSRVVHAMGVTGSFEHSNRELLAMRGP